MLSKSYTILAIADTMIAGLVTTLPSRLVDLPQDGEVGALYVSPEYWDRKIGPALIAAGRERRKGLHPHTCVYWTATTAPSGFTDLMDGRPMEQGRPTQAAGSP